MTKLLITILTLFWLVIPASAGELTAPEVPGAGYSMMPQNTASFSEGLLELVQNGLYLVRPEWEEAANLSSGIILSALVCSLLSVLSEKMAPAAAIAGTVTVSAAILRQTHILIGAAADTVREICEYGKLLCPVLTTALAAQGGISSSAALYAGTTAFLTLLGSLLSRWLIPMVYCFLIFSIAACALDQAIFKKFAETLKNLLHWLLKALLLVFTTYLTVTGAVSGTTDAAALKAAKLTVSTVVPVVGGILSDASESVLVSMGIIKNAAGIYGMLATLAVFAGPFVTLGVQYLMLKATALICSLFPGKNLAGLTEAFAAAMGMLLAMVAVSCVLVLISTVSFLKGIG